MTITRIFLCVLLGVVLFVPATAGQLRTAPTQGKEPVETTPRILDIIGSIRRQSDTLRASVDDTMRALRQGQARLAGGGSPEDRQRALVVAQQMLGQTLVVAKKSAEETAQLFDAIDAELAVLQREGESHADQLRRFRKEIDDEVGRQQALVASVALAAENIGNALPPGSRTRLPAVLTTRNAVREALVDAYRQQDRQLADALDEIGAETRSAIGDLRLRVQSAAEENRFFANAFDRFRGQLVVQVEADRILDGVSRRREEMDRVEEELVRGNQPVSEVLRMLGTFNELRQAVDEDRRRQRDQRRTAVAP